MGRSHNPTTRGEPLPTAAMGGAACEPMPLPQECCVEQAVLVETATGSLVEVGGEKGRSEGRATRKGGSQSQSHRGGKRAKGTACGDSNTAKRRKPQEEGGDQEKAAKLGESSKQASKSPHPAPTVPSQDPQTCSEWSRCVHASTMILVWCVRVPAVLQGGGPSGPGSELRRGTADGRTGSSGSAAGAVR